MSFYVVKKDAFAKKNAGAHRVRPEPVKNNLKIHTMDLEIIDILAKARGVSRAELVNLLVDRAILKFLESFASRTESSLLVQVADIINEVDVYCNLKESWYSDLYPSEVNISIEHELFNRPVSIFSEQDKSPAHLYMLKLIKEYLIKKGYIKDHSSNEAVLDGLSTNQIDLEKEEK